LEYVNRIRADPTQELYKLCNYNGNQFASPPSPYPNIANALTFFKVDASVLKAQCNLKRHILRLVEALNPAPPVAWDTRLGQAANYWSNVQLPLFFLTQGAR